MGTQQDQETAQGTVERARALGADVAEAVVQRGQHLSTRVRDRAPELVEESGSRSLGLRVMVGQRVANTHTNDLSPEGVQRLVEDAVELAKLAEEDPFAGVPHPSELCRPGELCQPKNLGDLDLYDAAVSSVDGEIALASALEAEEAAFSEDPRITNSEGASYGRVEGASTLVTSGGFVGSVQGTYASLSVRPVAEDGDKVKRTGSYWSACRHLGDMIPNGEVGRLAAERTVRKLGARKVPSQDVAVVFDPDTGRSILGLLAGCVMGNAVWRKSTYLADREGSEVASSNVTLTDDPLIHRGPGSRLYDGEGLASRRNVVVEQGVLKTFLMDSYSARKLGKESTASASRGSSGGVAPSTTNLCMQPGDLSRDALISSTQKGFYVTEMMGFGFNAVTGDFSRGASGFWIENGELTFPVNEVTISLNLDALLKRIDGVANDVDRRSSIMCPTFRVSSMTLAGS